MKRKFLALTALLIVANVAFAVDANAADKLPKDGKVCTTQYSAPTQTENGVAINFTVRCSREAKRRGLR